MEILNTGRRETLHTICFFVHLSDLCSREGRLKKRKKQRVELILQLSSTHFTEYKTDSQ